MALEEKLVWKIYAGAVGALTTLIAQKLVTKAWEKATGEVPPDPNDPDTPPHPGRDLGGGERARRGNGTVDHEPVHAQPLAFGDRAQGSRPPTHQDGHVSRRQTQSTQYWSFPFVSAS